MEENASYFHYGLIKNYIDKPKQPKIVTFLFLLNKSKLTN